MEGFTGRIVAALPPGAADADAQDRAGRAGHARDARTTASHHHRLVKTGAAWRRAATSSAAAIPLFFNNDVLMGVIRPAEAIPETHVLPQRRRRRDALLPRGQRHVRERLRHAALRPGRLHRHPDRHHLAADARTRASTTASSTSSRRPRSSRRSATSTTTASCWSTRPYSQPRPHAPESRSRAHDDRRLRDPRQGARPDHGLPLPAPPVRRRRLGRLPVPVPLQHRRLRADHRARPPAAAGAPDVRGAQLRRLLVRAAQVRLPPAGDSGALQPLEHQQRRGHLLRGGQLHEPPRRGDQLVHGASRRASRTARIRARSRRRSARRRPRSWP